MMELNNNRKTVLFFKVKAKPGIPGFCYAIPGSVMCVLNVLSNRGVYLMIQR